MAALSMADVALSKAQGSGDDNLTSISPEDMIWVEAYALQHNATSSTSTAQLQRFNEVFRRATTMAATGKGVELVDKLCGIVPGVVRRATDDDIAAGALSQETSRTYEYMLTMLCSPKELTLSSVALLLRPLCQLNTFNIGSNTWLELTPSIDLYISNISFSKDRFSSMCSDLLQYLTDRIPEMAPLPSERFKELMVKDQAFSDVVNGIHTIACWGLLFYGSSPELGVVRDSVGRLQEIVWQQLIDVNYYMVAMKSIEAAIQATIAPTTEARNEPLSPRKWLEEKRILWRLLIVRYTMVLVPKVKRFLTSLGKIGLLVKETDFLDIMRCFSNRPPVHPVTDEHCKAVDLIHTTMLEVLDISAYSDNFLEHALGWWETRQGVIFLNIAHAVLPCLNLFASLIAKVEVVRLEFYARADSVIEGSRIFNILRKLLKIDRPRRFEKRFCTLLRACATNISNSQLLDCLKAVADHYNTSHVTESSEDSILAKDDEQAKLLQACSDADLFTYVSTDMASGALNRTKVYIQKAETWKDKEIDLDVHMSASSKLTKALSTTFPYTRHETAKKCLERLVSAKQLSIGLNPNRSYCNTFASVIATAMSAEVQALEALKNESLLQCKVAQQIEELSERHLREYDALRQEQYERLTKFAEACRTEKEDVIWEALIHKAKVLASVERARAGKDEEMSSEDILKKLVRNAEGACKQMEDKHKESLPNPECSLCCEEFSKKRKRACLDPCGHASACADCATQEWKRTRTCFVCKARIEKLIAVPFQLYF